MQKNKGQLLLEILVVVAVMSTIIGLGSQMIIVSMRSSKSANERNVAMGLMEETFETTKIIAAEKWQNIYDTSKGSANHYHSTSTNGKWILAAGDASTTINGLIYTGYFITDNVSRDSNKEIESTYNSSNDDPSTQKITAYVSWTNGETVTYEEYITRWRNKVCYQTNWGGGKTNPSDPVPSDRCFISPTNIYYNDDGNVDLDNPDSLKIKPL
jgi:type II secretory pathway pseudopilin PulG